ncbi:magnesium/cobalt transporter CorA [Thiohalomonas denitrificans]|uniref:Magnesium transport protein CorA n=1 Tax=Thiohalomonas denitrificans TaxID=415747 RepID=A0A1G5Q6H7_9GAMM|nr:magnesium/cobalt transporter CorA [Thiohalomonas denitrificans]SCZ57464.1 magnesium transporter [Thiohalomonas denitrificans]
MNPIGKRYHPPGTPPGTLMPAEPAASLRITLVDYSESTFEERELSDPAEADAYLSSPTTTWIHIQGNPGTERLQAFGDLFGLHPLALEDVMNVGQRPKVDRYDGQLFAVLARPWFDGDDVAIEQVSIFYGRGFIVSFDTGDNDPFKPVRRRLQHSRGRIRTRSADYLLYTLFDFVIDTGFPLLDDLGDRVDELESDVLEQPRAAAAREIHRLRRHLLLLRRMLWPQREAVNNLLRDGDDIIHEETRPYIRDCYDHTIQIMELIEVYRDMASSILEVHLSAVNNRLSEVMRVLTVIATIFIPLTFIAGVYGMNFHHPGSPWAMPELYWYYGYPVVLLTMLFVAGGLLLYFWRKGWLSRVQ